MRNWLLVASLLALGLPGAGSAKELEVTARATVAIPPSDPNGSTPVDPQAIRAQAFRAARLKAVKTAIDKVLGPDATRDPRVAAKVDAIAQQIPDDRVVDQKGSRIGNEYEMSVTLVLDDKAFRTMLSDAGIAVNTATARAYSLLAVMDEFLTSPRDVKAPVEELLEWSHDKGSKSHDKSTASASSIATKADASASQASLKGSASSNTAASGAHDTSVQGSASDSARLSGSTDGASLAASRSTSASMKGTDKGSFSASKQESAAVDASASSASASSSLAAKASSSKKDVGSQSHDVEVYRKLVKYQPQGVAPEKTSQTFNAFMGQLQDYDLRVIDNDVFKSKYFAGRPITIEQLQDGVELAKYVTFARTDANADFFMVGTAVVFDGGVNPNTGFNECTGFVTLKTYSTVDGESIASETISEESAGRNINDCAAVLAKKMAGIGGPIIGARIQEYWKRRSTYGREYVLNLTGKSLPLMVRAAFTRAVKGIPGVENDVQRAATDKQLQMVVTYKGTEPIDQAVAMALASNPAFADLDSRTQGNQVQLCMGPCGEPASPPPPATATPEKRK